MPNLNASLNLHWQHFIELACARFAASNTAIGIEVAPMLLPFADTCPSWNHTPTTLPLASCLGAIEEEHLRHSMAAIATYLTWKERGVFSDSDEVNRAYVELVGPEGVMKNEQLRFGIYWQQAHTFYPKHRHDALELYHVVSGTALWQVGNDDFKAQKPGASFEHLDRVDHAAQTTDEDLLALWAWRGDLSFDNYTMDTLDTLDTINTIDAIAT